MISRTLTFDPGKCNGCNDCETACSAKHSGSNHKALARIRIINEGNKGEFHLPVICRHCETPSCLSACPTKAITRDEDLNRVIIDHQLCVGCRMCVHSCPFGIMRFDENRGLASKCDLCEGNPECVRVCESKALTYTDDTRLQEPRLMSCAHKFYRVRQRR